MAKTVFVSIVHEDKQKIIHQLKDWKNKNQIPPIDFRFEEKDLRHLGKPEVEKYLKELIDGSQVVVFIIGNDTHNHQWIEWEYNYAQNQKKKLVYFRTKSSTGAPPKIMGNILPIEFSLDNFKKEV